MKTNNFGPKAWAVIAIAATVLGSLVHYHQTGQIDLSGLYDSVVGLATGAGLFHLAHSTGKKTSDTTDK